MEVYRIKDLAILSGVKAHTIRMWEKRYNLLKPSRNEHQQRLYNTDELTKLLNISILYNAGWKISKIAALTLNQLHQEVEVVSEEQRFKSIVVTLFIETLLEFDHLKFERILNKSIEKEGFEAVYVYYLLPFLKRIGVLWIANSISPAQEHFISNIIRQKMIVATNAYTPAKHSTVDFVLFTPSGELHEIGLLYYQFQLCKRGNNVIYLGVDVPTSSVVKVIDQLRPRNILFSMAASQDEGVINKLLSELRETTNAPIYLGGSFLENTEFLELENLFYAKSLLGV